MDPNHPYSYIRALYNLVVCSGVAVIAVFTTRLQKKIVSTIKAQANAKFIMSFLTSLAAVIFVGLVFSSSIITLHTESLPEIITMLCLALIMSGIVAISTTYYVKYDEAVQTNGLTAWSIAQAKEMFKGKKINDAEGEKVIINWKLKEGEEDTVNFSTADMAKMKANIGDLVYLCDKRKWLGGLKSIHSVFGDTHSEDGIVYVTKDQIDQGQFVKNKLLLAEKEM